MTGNKILLQTLLCILFFSLFFLNTLQAETISLPDGLRRATEQSRLLRMSHEEEMISEAESLSARSKMLPRIDSFIGHTMLSHQQTALFGTQAVPMSERGIFSYSLGVQQTLYDFRGNASHYEAARTMANTKRMDTQRIKNLVAINFVLIYFDLLESGNMLSVVTREVERLESHLMDTKSLYEEGVITKNDLLQAEVRIADARQRLLTARNLREITASRLNTALQKPLREEVMVSDIIEVPSAVIGMDIEKAWIIAEKQRAEIRIAEEISIALGLEEEAKKAEYYPHLFLKGGYDYVENRYQLYPGNWSVTLGATFNLFSGESTKAEVNKLSHQRKKLQEEKKRLIDEIRLEVEKYILDLSTAGERVLVAQNAVQQAEENHRINKVRYEEGVGIATEVLDAVTLLTIAETNYYRSLYDLRKAEAAVLYAIGTDISEVYR